MPLMYGKDTDGNYVKWGKNGKKYYYHNEMSKTNAVAKANKQVSAIFASGYKKK